MPITKTGTKPARPVTETAQRHQEGLQAVTRLLGQPDATYDQLLDLARTASLDDALFGNARRLFDHNASTTARLEMPRDRAWHLLFLVMRTFEEEWSDPMPALDGRLDDESTLNTLGDHARTLADLSYAMASDSAHHSVTVASQERYAEELRQRARRQTEQTGQAEGSGRRVSRHPGVDPATVARLQALRSEFAFDPVGIELLIDMATAIAGPSVPASTAQTQTEARQG